MNEPYVSDTEKNCLQLDNALLFRPNRIKEIVEIVESNDRDIMSKTLNKYIRVLDHADKTLLILSGAVSSVSLLAFTTAICASVGIASAKV